MKTIIIIKAVAKIINLSEICKIPEIFNINMEKIACDVRQIEIDSTKNMEIETENKRIDKELYIAEVKRD
jgi:hypothetical protein